MSDRYNATEFYISGETRPFCRRSALMATPRVGEGIGVADVSGRVVSVVWNMDYYNKPHEQWRCNIYIKPDPKP